MPIQRLKPPAMLASLKLLLPALIPSWRFFEAIAPSPRIEYAFLKSSQDAAGQWQEFRPRPAHLSFTAMLRRLFWNAPWNETLFLVSCAERLIENPTAHSQQEILTRIKTDLKKTVPDMATASYLQFRLVFVSRHETELHKEILLVSSPYPFAEVPLS